MTKQSHRRKESYLSRYMKAPFRFLMKARDMYVRGMIECSTHFSYVNVSMGCPSGQVCTLPRSFSVNSETNDDDFNELVRAASLKSFGDRRQPVIKVPRSRSVAIGRIDEDKPCDFGDDMIKLKPHIYPRSRSYAIRRGGAGLF
ncbi:uncharacterized protein LOC113860054 [Abrus precatorius]|uniref:Uncharacterized protein LOC113860054 n=1 Tax=Abrus precatorius TaxID=3816 RepID=A0A8B8L1G8_ABRPR|nr:uncharacterized protein LOC113860054 [Abrus precatorius]